MNKLQIDKEAMVSIAKQMRERAYAPYSKFNVGACIMADDGTFFGGCNVENAAYGVAVCAETTAICSMIAAGKKKIMAIAVIDSGNKIASPCGRCRQAIREFALPDTIIYLCDNKGEICKTVTIDELLPMSFGPEYLNV